MVLFPKLAKTLPDPGEVQEGRVGRHLRPGGRAGRPRLPRIVTRLTSEHAEEMLLDPEIDDRVDGKSQGAAPRRQARSAAARPPTPGPRSRAPRITSSSSMSARTPTRRVIRKSIHPMLAFYAGTIVKIGTPGYHKGDFYKAINVNKRRQTPTSGPARTTSSTTTASSASTTPTTPVHRQGEAAPRRGLRRVPDVLRPQVDAGPRHARHRGRP